jgi:hypothetical protein
MSGQEHQHKDAPGNGGKGSLLALVLFWGCAGIYASLFMGWLVFPKLLYSEQNQPVDFSHAIHSDAAGMACEDCHFYREDGSYLGAPALEKCAECHTDVQTAEPVAADYTDAKEYRRKKARYDAEVLLVNEYVAKEKEIPWLVYSRQPDCVFFSHIAHTSPEAGAMECKECHGPVEEADTLPVYKENRITGYSIDIWGRNISGVKHNSWDSMKMDDCANCHKERKEDLKGMREPCFVCHK